VELSAKLGGGSARWDQLWIYAVGPTVGGIVAVYVYDVLIAGRPLMYRWPAELVPDGPVRPGLTPT
jgi:hypothetical protein